MLKSIHALRCEKTPRSPGRPPDSRAFHDAFWQKLREADFARRRAYDWRAALLLIQQGVTDFANFLAFPNCPRSLVIFGSGYGWSALAAASWLHQRAIHYWGDIDTHGFAILDQLRSGLPHVRSMLMNREVLLHHREFWTTEPNPVRHELPRLTAEEKSTLEALKANSGVAAPRLEQEKLPFSILQNALRQVLDGVC